MCHMPQTKIFKKTQKFNFFKKEAPEANKIQILKKYFQNCKRASKIGYKTCATCPEQNFSKN